MMTFWPMVAVALLALLAVVVPWLLILWAVDEWLKARGRS